MVPAQTIDVESVARRRDEEDPSSDSTQFRAFTFCPENFFLASVFSFFDEMNTVLVIY